MFGYLNKEISTNLAITIIVLVIVLIGGVLAYQYWWTPKEEAQIPEAKLPEYAINWQTYESKKYNFEVSYSEGYLIHKTLGENMEVDGFYIVPENMTMHGYELAIKFEEDSIAKRVREIEESASKFEHFRIIEISDFMVMRHSGKKIKTETKLDKSSEETITSTIYLFEGFTLTRGYGLHEELADKIVSTFRIIK